MSTLKNLSPELKRGLTVGAAALVGIAAWIGWRQCQVGATPPPPPPATAPELPVAVEAVDAGAPVDPKVVPTTATIVFSVYPSWAKATVTWGKQRLGRIESGKPLVVVRPRDSGPLDVIVRAEGFLPVQTRAHTFNDTKVAVKLTKPEEMPTLLGYKVPIDAGVPDENLDAIGTTGEAPPTTDPTTTVVP